MGKGFSVIIPTLWLPCFFEETLVSLNDNIFVDEVIIIANAKTPKLPMLNKVHVIQQDNNIGVNPAWNLGVKLALSNNIMLLNDDLQVSQEIFPCLLDLITNDEVGIVGIDPLSKDLGYPTTNIIEERPDGYGCLMVFKSKNYSTIPEGLDIYFGDDWLLFTSKKKGLLNLRISGFKTNGVLSMTSRNFTNVVYRELARYTQVTQEYDNN